MHGLHSQQILLGLPTSKAELQWLGLDADHSMSLMQTAAFYDAPVLITSLNVVKSYLLFGDVQKGSFFVRWVGAAWLRFKDPGSARAHGPSL